MYNPCEFVIAPRLVLSSSFLCDRLNSIVGDRECDDSDGDVVCDTESEQRARQRRSD